MSKFDLGKVKIETNSGLSPYVSYGTGHVLKINQIELVKSVNTGNSKAIIHVETKPIKDDGFKPVDGAKGQVGKIALGVYMKTDEQKNEFIANLKAIAEAMDLKEDIEEISGDVFEAVVQDIDTMFKQNKRYARFSIFAEEYQKPENKIGLRLYFPRYNFVEHLDVDPEKSKLVKFDKTNSRHYKAFVATTAPVASKLGPVDDLPF